MRQVHPARRTATTANDDAGSAASLLVSLSALWQGRCGGLGNQVQLHLFHLRLPLLLPALVADVPSNAAHDEKGTFSCV
ncbi:hypothetical protein BDA96_05G241700 [Sorghum bicolor]|jgi:hypothetical protein|uniref:Uncharacterized protein n=1 Tax=Sorghum bicolor TaxID=4558 RepID=A0A921QZW2_SORBI|nr:hypothetical protein BDA96_05G241700 [Sorghum bicolor]